MDVDRRRGATPTGRAAGKVRTDDRGRRRAITLLALTLFVPGSAQYVAGNRRLGVAALRVWLGIMVVLALAGVMALIALPVLLGFLTQGWLLRVIEVLLVAGALGWAVLFVDAWRLGQPNRLGLVTRRWLAGALGAVLVLVPGGMVYAASSVDAGRSALASIFGSGGQQDSAKGRYNVLVLGGDSGADRIGTRPDSIQVASIDEESGQTVLFGFARDTEGIHFREGSVMAGLLPNGWACGDNCLLNGLYTWASDHADQFPTWVDDPGILATTEAVEALSGLDIQYYVLVDLAGFSGLVDAVGGLQVTVMRRTPIGGGTSKISGWIEPGTQRLDGYHALWYARSREGSSNYERMARQRCVLSAMVNQLDPMSVALRFPEIARASGGVLRTDIPAAALPTFASLAVKARTHKITSVNFVPPLINPWSYEVDAVHHIVQETLAAATSGSSAIQSTPSAPATPTVTDSAPEATSTSTVGQDGSSGDSAQTDDLAAVCSAG